MPTADQHRVKAERNRAFLATVSPDDHPEWVVVAAFYVAVHLVERLRAAAGDGDSQGHADRRLYVQAEHPTIYAHYRALLNASMVARYESSADFFAEFQPGDVIDKVVAGRVEPIEAYVRDWFAP